MVVLNNFSHFLRMSLRNVLARETREVVVSSSYASEFCASSNVEQED